jgi:YVTN family beta-propeller protein
MKHLNLRPPVTKRNLFYQILFVAILFTACRKDKPPVPATGDVTIGSGGVYITNEGNFQFGNASVSYYDVASGNSIADLYQPANGVSLGDVCQSMYIFNDKAYLVLNNSNKITVVDPETFVTSATITGFTSPRYFLPVSNSKAYVTDFVANSISIVDLTTNAITGTIPCQGWTEELTLSYGNAFVTNYNTNKVYVINTATDLIVDSISVSYGGNCIREDRNGKLWVSCAGNQSNNSFPGLYKINPITMQVEQSFIFSSYTDSPWRLRMNGTNDTLYFLNNGVYRMAITDFTLPITAFISQGSRNFYGLGIDPSSGIVYVADAVDYVQRGVIYRFNSLGTVLNTFQAGIIPGDFYFNR